MSSTSLESQTKITRYIVFMSKHLVSLCVLRPVKFKWLNFRWNIFFRVGCLESRDAKHLLLTSCFFPYSNMSIFKSTSVFLHQTVSQSIGLYLTRTSWLVREKSSELASKDMKSQNTRFAKIFELSCCSDTDFCKTTCLIHTTNVTIDIYC